MGILIGGQILIKMVFILDFSSIIPGFAHYRGHLSPNMGSPSIAGAIMSRLEALIDASGVQSDQRLHRFGIS